MENRDTGLLINKHDTGLFRKYFREMTSLIGIKALFRSLKPQTKEYDLHGELDAIYNPPVEVGCIFESHPSQKTMRKLGWNAERENTPPVIHVPYDLVGLEAGTLFIIPSGLDKSEGRVFRVLEMSVEAVYPASISCTLGPVLKNQFERSQGLDFSTTNFNLLIEEDQ